jgi:hypothetical protein
MHSGGSKKKQTPRNSEVAMGGRVRVKTKKKPFNMTNKDTEHKERLRHAWLVLSEYQRNRRIFTNVEKCVPTIIEKRAEGGWDHAGRRTNDKCSRPSTRKKGRHKRFHSC